MESHHCVTCVSDLPTQGAPAEAVGTQPVPEAQPAQAAAQSAPEQLPAEATRSPKADIPKPPSAGTAPQATPASAKPGSAGTRAPSAGSQGPAAAAAAAAATTAAPVEPAARPYLEQKAAAPTLIAVPRLDDLLIQEIARTYCGEPRSLAAQR